MTGPMIHYVSTRAKLGAAASRKCCCRRLAEDGGLFVPERWPSFSADSSGPCAGWTTLTRGPLAGPLHRWLLRRGRSAAAGPACLRRFDHPATAPLRHLADDAWLLELFHGPTLAFKDFAMQLLAAMFDEVLARRGQRVTIVGATSGDTGAAAIRAFAGKGQIRIAMLHPEAASRRCSAAR